MDGTSNTLALGEYLRGITDPTNGDGRGMIWTNRAGSQFLYVTQTPNNSIPDISIAYQGFCDPAAITTHNLPGQNLPCSPDNGIGFGSNATASPRSRHPGGVNCVFCDGHVVFITNNVNFTTWQNLGFIADGQIPGDY